MAQGRGFSAMILFCCVLVLLSEMADATSFVVGDNNGWSFNTNNWPNGKKFKAGDVLVFNYDPSHHDVRVVDVNGYNSCNPSKASKSFHSGHDQVTLAQGTTYFICSFPGHCQQGMKIAINAA
ncbi:hypothetical protein PHAVU_006G212900 [Phaseolus vulgaris]|uniref:Basic blue protein n=1 Tax=Phaseolus vulgaris TaxID=3885 RepID=V7BV86_PHAVU|nr:hypothetical protein PHAVU_006G212900g [Phaseolus vulgaris]ESW20481.1 hypothetical protein PHAVU_006G212900g [Phaseolus vulgaris]